jgi:MFS family permease
MQWIAQQWLVFRLTGSLAMLGVINLLAVLPVAPLSLWGGSLADRFPRRSLMIATQSAMMSTVFILAWLTWTEVVQVWHLLALAMALGAANAVNEPVSQALLVETVDNRDDLTSAIGLNAMVFNAARTIGPALAGVAVATVGEAAAFFVNGITFAAIIVCLAMMRFPASRPLAGRPRLGAHLWEAVRYVGSQRTILVLISLVAVSAFLSMPFMILLPVFASDVLSESAQPLLDTVCAGSNATLDCQSPDAVTYGLLMAATGLGAVVGALLVASRSSQARRGRWLTAASLSFPMLLLGMALSRSLPLTLALLVGIGLSFVTLNSLAYTLIQVIVPDQLRGRVMSFYSIAFLGMTRLGGMQAGVVGDTFGAPVAVGIGAALCMAYSAFVAWRYPSLRDTAQWGDT